MLRKILIVIPSDDQGGAEKVLKMIASHYVSRANVTIFFFTKKINKFVG